MYNLPFAARKLLRTFVLRSFLIESGFKKVVIFSCGNASDTLKRHTVGLDMSILAIAPNGDLAPTNKWWTPEEIHATFPDYFDATSGHLPMYLMVRMAEELRKNYLKWIEFPLLEGQLYRVPTGSGETIHVLYMAFPKCTFVPVYGEGATAYNHQAPLNFALNQRNGRVYENQ